MRLAFSLKQSMKKNLIILGFGLFYSLVALADSNSSSTTSTSGSTSTSSSTSSKTSTVSSIIHTDSSKLSTVTLSSGGKTARVTPQRQTIITEYYYAPTTSTYAGKCCSSFGNSNCLRSIQLYSNTSGSNLYWACQNTYTSLSSSDSRWAGMMDCSTPTNQCNITNTNFCCSSFNSTLQGQTENVVYAIPSASSDYTTTQPTCGSGSTITSSLYQANSSGLGVEYYICTGLYNPNDVTQKNYYNALSKAWLVCLYPATSSYCTTQYTSLSAVPPTVFTPASAAPTLSAANSTGYEFDSCSVSSTQLTIQQLLDSSTSNLLTSVTTKNNNLYVTPGMYSVSLNMSYQCHYEKKDGTASYSSLVSLSCTSNSLTLPSSSIGKTCTVTCSPSSYSAGTIPNLSQSLTGIATITCQ